MSVDVVCQEVLIFPQLLDAIVGAIDEDGSIRESAGEDVRRTRGKVRAIQGRIRGILKVRRILYRWWRM